MDIVVLKLKSGVWMLSESVRANARPVTLAGRLCVISLMPYP